MAAEASPGEHYEITQQNQRDITNIKVEVGGLRVRNAGQFIFALENLLWKN